VSSFVTAAGVHITETETDSGDYSFTWTETHGLDDTPVRFELVYSPQASRWVRFCWPDACHGGANELHWPWEAVNDMDEARELVRQRVGM
jgi:hypothetical protein